MHIREAVPDDNEKLQEVQSTCPMAASLLISTVNTPDFFARAKAYEAYKIYVACEADQIIGSAAVALRNPLINSTTTRVGFEFQYFTAPSHRRKGVAQKLHHHIEKYLAAHDALLSYLTIMEGNLPSMRFFERQGFSLHRTLALPVLWVYKKVDIPNKEKIRPATVKDLPVIAELLNATWQDYDLWEPTSAEALNQFIDHTPAYNLENLVVYEEQKRISACMGFWDWSKISQITVKALQLKYKIAGSALNILSHLVPMPRVPTSGQTLNQGCLTLIGFENPKLLTPLFRYMNNDAFNKGIEQIFCVCEQGHELLKNMKGLHMDMALHLYVKPLREITLGKNPVFLNTIDL